ncbi:MAG: 30S ribosomal protein S12 methylthiotransferase RimO [Clostridia bacterium]|nr:30S ribosomal protein S12 methylthiotransferase RimO [Clostridia bacterium]
MLAKLKDAGMEIVIDDIDADVVVVNTCAFIADAKKESIDTILDVAWLKEHRNLKGIVAAGCLVQRYKDELFSELPEIDAAIGIGDLESIVDAVNQAYESGVGKKEDKYSVVTRAENQILGGDRVVTGPEYSVYLKIAEGCDNHCTFCAIPSIRGKLRSRKIEEIVSEAKELALLGAKELVVVAQDTTSYGKDIYGKASLDVLLKELCKVDGIKWIRVLYCYPEDITESLVDVIANEPKIVKYIDLPIQHISDKVLKKMGRRGDSALIKEKIALLRSKVPGIVIRTTVMVGFPTEDKEDFALLAEFLKEAKFERLGAFAFSSEEGTPAHEIKEGRVPENIKKKRLDVIMKNQYEIHKANNKKMLGQVIEVLCEGFDRPSGVYFGRSANDAPEIDGKVYFSSKRKINDGEFVNVKINEVIDYDLLGETLL